MPATTTVREVMTTDVVTVRPDMTLAEAADVLADHGIGAAPVLDDTGAVVGLLRDEDLLVSEARLHLPTTIAILPGVEFTLPSAIRRYDEELRKAIGSTVGEVMTTDVPTVDVDDSVEDLATLMHQADVTHVVVTDGGRLAGIASRGDLVRFLARTT